MNTFDYSRLRYEAVRVARANLGYGETEGNNAGRFIRAMGGADGNEWCALFAGYCYRRAYENLKLDTPQWCFRRPGVLELGAKALTKALGRAGRIFKPSAPVAPLVGDLVAWSRGMLSWQGHVGIVTEVRADYFNYIAGNEGKNGRVVHRRGSYTNPKLWRFASVQP
jgi:hypothetical protein